jgi:hypothetical protein
MSSPNDNWISGIAETSSWLDGQLCEDLPQDIRTQIAQQRQCLAQLN